MFAGFDNQSPLLTRWFHCEKWPQSPETGNKKGFEGMEHEFWVIHAVKNCEVFLFFLVVMFLLLLFPGAPNDCFL